MGNILDWAGLCTECGECVDVCPTYNVTQNPIFSPPERLKTAIDIFEGGEVDELHVESIYNCPKCMNCEAVCPEEIPFTRVLHESRRELVHRGLGPTEKHNKVIRGILEKGNSVNGDPERRLDWLPEEFPGKDSDTLLYLGCLPSYLVKDAATATYLVLKKLGLDFMILEDEGCCGTYLYESGRTDIATEYFERNLSRFRSMGIKRIVVPCSGCFKCFKYFYPDLLGDTGLQIQHAVETTYELLKENPDMLNKVDRTVSYQDSCRLVHGENLTAEPRQILGWCGAEVKEMDYSHQGADCCGAGGGIRSVYRNLSMDIAASLLGRTHADPLVTTCPFCAFNLNYASRKKGLDKQTIYFSRIVLDSMAVDS